VNVPFGVLGLLASHRVLDPGGARASGSLDVRGAASAAAGFALLTLSLSLGQEWGWTSPRLVTCLALAMAALVAGVLFERQMPHPIIDLTMLRERVFAAALASLTLSMLALFGVSAGSRQAGWRWRAWAWSCSPEWTRRARPATSSRDWS
jgi:hypothetical protein